MAGYPAVLVVLALGVAHWSTVVEGFSSGPPSQACGTLAPNPQAHDAPPQTTPVPYEIDLSSLDDGNGGYCYQPGDTYACEHRWMLSIAYRGGSGQ